MAKKGIVWTENSLQTNLRKFPVKLEAAIGALMQYEAPKVQDYMRSNAPWTDRTGNARNGLFAKYKGKPGQHVIVLYHTVPYGIWLEVRFDGQYAIIVPTLLTEGKRIMKDLTKLMAQMDKVA